jgi:hypothetical protein
VELTAMPLMDDPDTGMRVIKLIYRAGFTNPWHTHPCTNKPFDIHYSGLE